ncbi:diphosphomevalonate/mevalonate 3,5-bisphosphate decarboxylase family protein [Legionella sp. W05-934-2]|jgi:diphosphomevalonate decarboxylase|uniref:diphosphomevalonate/mevalonate 3,5-bisphosphate decarboxylase family protein n=1 Tax=Legionella sp. W05-934-2 TaxID=1198649 RepID=UPI003461B55F
MQWFAQAPANIALIKYMGKSDEQSNLPANPSLSYTLNKLQTSVVLEQQSGNHDFWEPLNIPGAHPFMLPMEAQKRYLDHLNRIKAFFNFTGAFVVRSTNNFPHSSGLASSASSFAALTKCAANAICDLQQSELPDVATLANLSRQGSGSSCRSFFSPWALWDGDTVEAVNLPYSNLVHQVVIVSNAIKSVPSSEAHKRIKTSPGYSGRVSRAKENLKTLLNALTSQDWQSAYKVCWHEFQDMHHLFTTAAQPFTYMGAETTQALNALQAIWNDKKDGPIITMDAGPNIHLLYRPDQAQLMREIRADVFLGNFDVI